MFLVVFQKSEISKNAVSERWCSDSNWENTPFKFGFLCYLGMFQVNWDFLSHLGKNVVPETGPIFV